MKRALETEFHKENPVKIAKKCPEDISQLEMDIDKEAVLKTTERSKLQSYFLHQAACSFHKVPGYDYHLYRKESSEVYFGMLSPLEWSPPHKYLGTYRLESDLSWTKLNIYNKEVVLPFKYYSSQDKATDVPMEI